MLWPRCTSCEARCCLRERVCDRHALSGKSHSYMRSEGKVKSERRRKAQGRLLTLFVFLLLPLSDRARLSPKHTRPEQPNLGHTLAPDPRTSAGVAPREPA